MDFKFNDNGYQVKFTSDGIVSFFESDGVTLINGTSAVVSPVIKNGFLTCNYDPINAACYMYDDRNLSNQSFNVVMYGNP